MNDAQKVLKSQPIKSNGSPIVSLITGFVFTLIVLVLGLIAWSMLGTKPVPRTAAERDIARYEALVNARRGDPQAYIGLGLSYFEVGSYSLALKHIKMAIKLQPRNYKFYEYAGRIYKEQGDLAQALNYYNKAVKFNEKSGTTWFEIGSLHYDRGQYQKAIPPLFRSIEIEPEASDVHFLLGQTLEKINKTEAAIVQYQEALKYMPDYKDALQALVRLNGGKKKNSGGTK